MFVQNELTGGAARQRRNAAYLTHVLAAGGHPRLAQFLTPGPRPGPAGPTQTADPADRYRDILARILTGLLPGLPSPVLR